jgi:phosphoribosylformylglycinamidine synthase
MEYLIFPGEEAYTPSAGRKIQDKINKSGTAKVEGVTAVWVHYAYVETVEVGETETKLKQLLPGSAHSLESVLARSGPKSRMFHVTPRNISPWSSKATSIANVCGLKGRVHRLERGRVISVQFSEPSDGTEIPFKDLLCD